MALNGKKREKYQEKVFDGAVETRVVALRCSTPRLAIVDWPFTAIDVRIKLERLYPSTTAG